MISRSHRRAFAIRELIVVVVILAIMLAVLIPMILSFRESARRAQCTANLGALGVGFQYYELVTKRLPPSCRVTKDANGKITSMDGWSWCVDLLLSLDQGDLWQSLDIEGGVPLRPNADGTSSHADALATSIPEFRCPAFGGSPFVGNSHSEAITNYKAMGATHLESLNVASTHPTTPRYAPDSDRHPDGAIYPGSTHGYESFRSDGSAHTALLVETVEQNVARWTVGNECAVVGLPPVVEFSRDLNLYHHPTGYKPGAFWERSTVPPKMDKTYLDWDYETRPYSDGGVSIPSVSASGPMKYGPGSHHDSVTNHIFVNGSVHAIGNDVDVSLYMFIITRNNADP